MSKKYKYEIVKKEVDGLQYISKTVNLKKVGQIFRGCCPFHSEKTGSFFVYPSGHVTEGKKQDHASFYCFGCGVGGDVIEFKRLNLNLELGIDDTLREEACVELEKEIGLIIDEEKAQQEYLTDELERIKNSQGNTLSLTEINLICSGICRNYLLWVKEYYSKFYEDEIKVVEKFYRYFDKMLPEMTAMEAMSLIDEVEQKINGRRILLKQEMEAN
jgi:hypothetical protein